MRMTKVEWEAKGRALFGPDMTKWRFVCPCCGNVASPEDFRRYKAHGATPDSATHMCIGRFDGHMDVDMGTGRPCNYTGYGLFNFCPVEVEDENGKEHHCFAFDEGPETVITFGGTKLRDIDTSKFRGRLTERSPEEVTMMTCSQTKEATDSS